MRMRKWNTIQKIAVTLLALCIAAPSIPLAEATVVSAPLVTESGSEDGMVRVYLSSLGNPTSLSLTVVGSYSVNGDVTQSLSSGQSLTVGFSSATGAITLTRDGSKANMGTSFTLKRHSTTGTNGIKIAQGRVPGNPYPGDISFKAVLQSGSFKLYTIAHVYIENYLYGVLPYEMGNGANIEALKAQAVAARTYTVRMMQSRASSTYDVVDTTSDQVYNGTPSGNANCVAAVDGTKGIVLKNGSSYTGTYYSASNGGQMESIANIWGTKGYDYLCVKDDPFDLANPDSVVKKSTVYASCTGGSTNSSLLSLLKTKAVTELRSKGYAATADNTSLQTVKSVTPHSPKYASPSKLYTKMDFALTASTRNASGGIETVSVTVTCNIFTELESMLGMSIQSSSNELWSVRKSGNDFVLEARRYGHGLGMSQRGAMYMGKQGYSYDSILGFYYTNCKRVRISFTNSILAAGSSDQQTTVEDPAQVEEGDGACSGTVKLVGSSSSLAIRNAKSSSASILGAIANNSPVSVYANDGTWCFIRFGNIKGYVPTNSLSLSGTAPASVEETVTAISGFATVKANGYLNLRASGSSSASVVTTAPTGSIVTVFSNSGGWAQVQFGATVAYASSDFLAFSATYPGSTASSGDMTATVQAEDGVSSINLRSSPSTSSSALAQIPHGTAVTVVRDDGAWSTVVYNGITGYVVSSCLKYTEGTVDGGGTPGTGSTEETATVTSTAGVLYPQKDQTATPLMMIAMGQSVVVTERGDPWCGVRYEGVTGFMLTVDLALSSGTSGTGSGETAIVATPSGSLNLRMEANAGSSILTTIPRGAQVTVTSKGQEWSAVVYGGMTGYVMSGYLQFTGEVVGGDTPEGTGTPAAPASGTAQVTTQSGSLNLRAEDRAGSEIVRTIPRLATVTVNSKGLEWSNVTFEGSTGFAMNAFLTFASDGQAPVVEEEQPEGDGGLSEEENPEEPLLPEEPVTTKLYATVNTVSGSLNLRQDPLPGSPIVARIPKGTTIEITQQLSSWSKTVYGNQQGYVVNEFLTFVDREKPVDSMVMASVMTESGTLNLRAEPSLGAGIVQRIPRFSIVAVQQKGQDWSRVAFAGYFGYVMTQYLAFPGGALPDSVSELTEAEAAAASEAGTEGQGTGSTDSAGTGEASQESNAWVSTSGGALNLRSEGSYAGIVLATLSNATPITVLSYGESWCYVTYQNLTGYVMTQYLRFADAAMNQSVQAASESASQSASGQTASLEGTAAWVNTPSGSLNLRVTKSTAAEILTTIPWRAKVTVTSAGAEWSQISYHGMVGYVMSTYLTSEDLSGAVPSQTDNGDGSTGGTSGSQPAGGGNSGGGSASSADSAPVSSLDSVLEGSAAGNSGGSTGSGSDGAGNHSNGGSNHSSNSPGNSAESSLTQNRVLDPSLQDVTRVTYAHVNPLEGNTMQCVWAQCSEEGPPQATMLRGDRVRVLQQGANWCKIIFEDQEGYCLTAFLTILPEGS